MSAPHRTQAARLELKAVDLGERTISAYASTWQLDRQGDRIQPGAFQKCLGSKSLSDISVLIGHRSEALPVGRPVEIKEDSTGLFTRSKIFRSSSGDDLLNTARELMQSGGSLGLSIGYRPVDYEWTQENGRTVRLLREVDLAEYSFLSSPAVAANSGAVVTDVKRAAAPLTIEQAQVELAELDAYLRERDRRQTEDDVNRYRQRREWLADIEQYLEGQRTPEETQRLKRVVLDYQVKKWGELGCPESLPPTSITVPVDVVLSALGRPEVLIEEPDELAAPRRAYGSFDPLGVLGNRSR